MNKNILAIAIAAAVAAPSAFASATVYGVAHVGVASQDNGTDNSFGVLSNSSRLGVKGSEDLAGGMKAVYQMEFAVNMDGEGDALNGGSNLRNTFAGIGGGFGTVLLGRHDSPIKMVGRQFDLFGDQVGNARSITGANGTGALMDGRHSNVIAYASPSFGGFGVLAAYVPGGTADVLNGANATVTEQWGGKNLDAWTVNLTGKVGAVDLGAAYLTGSSKDAGAAADFQGYRLGASYSFGAAKIVATYQNDNMAKVLGGKGTRDVYGVGASYGVSPAGTVKAQYYIAGNNGDTKKSGGSLLNVGYDHALSKNTTAYVNYAVAANEDAGMLSVNMAGAGASETFAATANSSGQTKDNSAIAVGVIHKF